MDALEVLSGSRGVMPLGTVWQYSGCSTTWELVTSRLLTTVILPGEFNYTTILFSLSIFPSLLLSLECLSIKNTGAFTNGTNDKRLTSNKILEILLNTHTHNVFVTFVRKHRLYILRSISPFGNFVSTVHT